MRKAILITFFCLGTNFFIVKGTSLLLQFTDLKDKESFEMIDQQQKKENIAKVVYSCPMHPEIIQDKPGKCPKCGMNLVSKEIKKDVYVCPMHSEISQDKPGKCPKCGMNLVKKEPAKKTETSKK